MTISYMWQTVGQYDNGDKQFGYDVIYIAWQQSGLYGYLEYVATDFVVCSFIAYGNEIISMHIYNMRQPIYLNNNWLHMTTE